MSTSETSIKGIPDYEEIYKVYSRLCEWKYYSFEEPSYGYVIVMTKYWHEHGTVLEKMFLGQLKEHWDKKLVDAARERFFHYRQSCGSKGSKPMSQDEYYMRLYGEWINHYKSHPCFLEVVNKRNWMILPKKKADPADD